MKLKQAVSQWLEWRAEEGILFHEHRGSRLYLRDSLIRLTFWLADQSTIGPSGLCAGTVQKALSNCAKRSGGKIVRRSTS